MYRKLPTGTKETEILLRTRHVLKREEYHENGMTLKLSQ